MLFRSNICEKGKSLEKILNIEKGLEIDSCWSSITNDMSMARMIRRKSFIAETGVPVDITTLEIFPMPHTRSHIMHVQV